MRYVAALDGIRAVAITLAIMGHVLIKGIPGGAFGVDIFFVLSGFLITALLLEEIDRKGRVNLLHFYARRALRLYPPLLLLLAIVFIFFHVTHHVFGHALMQVNLAQESLYAGLYIVDYTLALGYTQTSSMFAHLWSLGVEEKFYLIWPFLLMALVRTFKGRRFVYAVVGLFVAATLWKFACLSFQDWLGVYFRADTRFSGLMAGALLAACEREGIRFRAFDRVLAVTGLLLALCVTTAYSLQIVIYETTLAEVFTFLLLYKILHDKKSAVTQALSHPAAVFIGRISYGLYLFHFPISVVCVGLGVTGWQAFAITVTGGLFLAWFSWNTVERAGRVKAQQFRAKAAARHLAKGA